jgi:hypothetical protein
MLRKGPLNRMARLLSQSLCLLALSGFIAMPGFARAETCSASTLVLEFTTGGDDLRGGNNNVDLEIHFTDNSVQFVKNVNQSVQWPGGSFRSVTIPLQQTVTPAQIAQIVLTHDAQAGTQFQSIAPPFPIGPLSQDNWDMSLVKVMARGSGVNSIIATAGPHRFTGNDPSFGFGVNPPVTCQSGTITQLQFTFSTTDDDLRGGNDNLNLIVHYADGSADQVEPNVNHGASWSNGSTRMASVFLDRASTVKSVTLQTTSDGGINGDNWNMGSVQILGVGVGMHQNLATAGFHRFTGPPGNSLTIPMSGWPAPPVPTVSGGPTNCSPTDTSAYCRTARMARAPAPSNSGPLLSGGTPHGAPPPPAPGNTGFAKPQATLNSSPQTLLSSQPMSANAAMSRQAPSTAVTPTQNSLTNADVITMARSGRPEAEIISRIQSAPHKFDLSPTGCGNLRQAAVTAPVLKAMADGSVVPCATAPARSEGRVSVRPQ